MQYCVSHRTKWKRQNQLRLEQLRAQAASGERELSAHALPLACALLPPYPAYMHCHLWASYTHKGEAKRALLCGLLVAEFLLHSVSYKSRLTKLRSFSLTLIRVMRMFFRAKCCESSILPNTSENYSKAT